MNVSLVTGCAGFIGSHLSETLLESGETVVGIDCFLSNSYDPKVKKSNLANLEKHKNFKFIEFDLRRNNLFFPESTGNITTVFHLAAMPGLPMSWQDTDLYIDCNVTATNHLITALNLNSLEHFVYISTSSVYGSEAVGNELTDKRPISPYGATKLSAEELLLAHFRAKNLPLTILRYFSVYGPRQRPDMAYSKFVSNLLLKRKIEVFGDGEQTRSNTFVLDAVRATIDLSRLNPNGEIYNVGGREKIKLINAINLIASTIGVQAEVEYLPRRLGDQLHTFADTGKLLSAIEDPFKTSFDEGIKYQIEWAKSK